MLSQVVWETSEVWCGNEMRHALHGNEIRYGMG